MEQITIRPAKSPEDYAVGKVLIQEYIDWLGFDLGFQSIDKEMGSLSTMYGAPKGALLLLQVGEKIAGVVGIRPFDADRGELKRMYIQPKFRGTGLGRRLLGEALLHTQNLGYSGVLLDTDSSMKGAIALYLEYGFMEIAPYRHNPIPTARYFELQFSDKD